MSACTPTIDLTGLLRSAFLDEHGRFAKHPDAVTTVRLYFDLSNIDLTFAEFMSLSEEQRTQIQQSGSAAGLVDTSGKSNA